MTVEVKDDREILLDEQTVWDFLRFANYVSSIPGMPFTPDLINSRMRDVTLGNVGKITESQVTEAMNDPKNKEDELIRISESFEISSTLYKRLLQYMSGLLSFDLTYYAKNVKKLEEYKSPAYQKDLDVLRRFLDAFDYKKEFSTVVKQLLREEAFFSSFREDGDKFVLQQLPGSHCKITGRFNRGLLFSYNYYWFLQGGVDIDLYPPIFRNTYNKLFVDPDTKKYNPSIEISKRGESSWVYWVDCSPSDNFWCWKMSPEIIAKIPYFTGLFPDIVLSGVIRGLQKSSYMSQAVKFILGEVALLNKDQKATVKDALSISPDILGKFMALIQSAVNSEAIRIASAPLTDMKGIEFGGSNEIQSSYSRNLVGLSGINSNLLYSGDVKPNIEETRLSADVDYLVMSQLYPTFSNFIEFFVNRDTKHYKFGIQFEGSSLFSDRQRRLETQTTLMTNGIVNPQKVAAAVGQSPFVFQAQLDEARANGWTKNLTPIIPATQLSGLKPDGRPETSESKISDEGAETQSQGSNLTRGGK